MKTSAFIYRFNDQDTYGNNLARLGSVNHANHVAKDPEGPKLQHIGFDYPTIHWSPYIMFDVVIATRQVDNQHVRNLAAQRIAAVEAENGSLTRADRKKIETQARLDYIPQAPIHRKRVSVFFADQHLYVQTSSAAVAETVVTWLRNLLNGMPVKTLEAAMAEFTPLATWMRTGVHERNFAPRFELGSDGTFTDGVSTIRVKNEDLRDMDLWNVLAGKEVKELGLYTREGELSYVLGFTLGEHWQIKNVQNMFEIEGEEWDKGVETYGDHLAGKILMASMLDELRRSLVASVVEFHRHLVGEVIEV